MESKAHSQCVFISRNFHTGIFQLQVECNVFKYFFDTMSLALLSFSFERVSTVIFQSEGQQHELNLNTQTS